MKKKNVPNPFNWKTALFFSIIITLIINGLVLVSSIEIARIVEYEASNEKVLIQVGQHFVMNVTLFFLLYMYVFKIIQMPIKSWLKALLAIPGTFVLTCILSTIFSLIMISLNVDEFAELVILFRLIRDLFVAIIVILSTTLLYTMALRQKTMVENEKLVAENIRNRYEALKNQVDPHFLFNSLNTLNGLIGYDDNRAHKYVEKLSSVFRYTIQNKEIIKLKEELDFTEAYSYLMKIRYGENFRIEYDIAEKYLSYYIMPISLQLQIENAVKHNVISNKYPLTIYIKTTDNGILIIENKIQPKTLPVAGTGIGLANLTERYKLLFHKDIIISNKNGIFHVEIPLILPEKIEEQII